MKKNLFNLLTNFLENQEKEKEKIFDSSSIESEEKLKKDLEKINNITKIVSKIIENLNSENNEDKNISKTEEDEKEEDSFKKFYKKSKILTLYSTNVSQQNNSQIEKENDSQVSQNNSQEIDNFDTLSSESFSSEISLPSKEEILIEKDSFSSLEEEIPKDFIKKIKFEIIKINFLFDSGTKEIIASHDLKSNKPLLTFNDLKRLFISNKNFEFEEEKNKEEKKFIELKLKLNGSKIDKNFSDKLITINLFTQQGKINYYEILVDNENEKISFDLKNAIEKKFNVNKFINALKRFIYYIYKKHSFKNKS